MPVRILVIDDAVTIRAYLQRLLGDAGYEVEAAMNGVEGLEAALARPPDLVICDVNMPQLDGLGFLERLRADPETRRIPVTMLTTEGRAQDIAEAQRRGAGFYMVKPPRPDLVLGVARLLAGETAA